MSAYGFAMDESGENSPLCRTIHIVQRYWRIGNGEQDHTIGRPYLRLACYLVRTNVYYEVFRNDLQALRMGDGWQNPAGWMC